MESKRVLWIGEHAGWPPGWPAAPASWRIDFCPPQAAGERLRMACDAVALDFPMPGWTPETLLHEVRRLAPDTPILIRDPRATASEAIRMSRLGAWQYLDSPAESVTRIAAAIEQFRPGLPLPGPEDWRRLLVGDSHAMRQVCHIIRMIGGRRATVLITGETGSGKEVAARALHRAGPRARGPFVAVNCSALPDHLLEDELFGHVRGAFTGALQARAGRFEQAHGGVLFLDEIGDLPMDLQPKLLRVLQEREFQRLGGSETVRVDIRVIAATNSDLAAKVAQGRFREDLYYRLNVAPIHMPPLRELREDIPALAAHIVAKVCRLEELPLKRLSSDALELLSAHRWPGNVRQLENAIEVAVAMSGDRAALTRADFALPASPAAAAPLPELVAPPIPDGGFDYEQTMAIIERSILEQALKKTGGNKKAAAEMLGLKRTTLSAKVRSLEAAAFN